MPKPVALITGPTSGIGAGFARRYAADGYDLVLVARDEVRLRNLSESLREKHRTESEVMVADLATADARAQVADRLTKGVRVLINNAGFGISDEFLSTDPQLLQAQLDVNITAVMHLTRAALPPMVAAGVGTVINVASVAGLVSGPLLSPKATYAASKAWVVWFSEGLANGLAGTGVGVHALCPGFVRTEFHERAGFDVGSKQSVMWLEIDDVVSDCVTDVAKGKVVIIPGLQYKVITGAVRVVPRALIRTITARFGRGSGRT
jgi:uncharacterized protein